MNNTSLYNICMLLEKTNISLSNVSILLARKNVSLYNVSTLIDSFTLNENYTRLNISILSQLVTIETMEICSCS